MRSLCLLVAIDMVSLTFFAQILINGFPTTSLSERSVPPFTTREEEAEFWQQHCSEDFVWEELAEPLEIDETFQERVRQRSARKRPLQQARAARR